MGEACADIAGTPKVSLASTEAAVIDPVVELGRAPQVLIVDDVTNNRDLLAAILEAEGYRTREAACGEDALAEIAREHPDLVLLDIQMPGISGLEVCDALKRDPETWEIPVVLVTALSEDEVRLSGYECGADDYVTKPVQKELLRARVRNLMRVRALREHMEGTEAVIYTMAAMIEARDKSTQGHLYRMSRYCEWLAEAIGLEVHPKHLRAGAILHDVGKIGIPDAVLLKDTALTPEEYDIMKQHPVIGERICRKLRAASTVCPMVRGHHERWDGAGYPDGLEGDEIPLLARVVSIADSFDAMVAERVYHKGMPWSDAMEILNAEKGSQWDPHLIDVFIAIMSDRERERQLSREAHLAAELEQVA